MNFWQNNSDLILQIILISFGILFLFGINYLTGAKAKIFKALDYFNESKDFTYESFGDFHFGISGSFYFIIPIPSTKKHTVFYQNRTVTRFRKEYRSIRKGFLIFLLIYSLIIAAYFIIDIVIRQ